MGVLTECGLMVLSFSAPLKLADPDSKVALMCAHHFGLMSKQNPTAQRTGVCQTNRKSNTGHENR